MGARRLVWRLVPTYLVVILVFSALVLVLVSRSVRSFLVERASADLAARARLVASQVEREGGEPERLSRSVASLARASSTRVTIVDADGTVLADSEGDPVAMDDHSNRPEIVEALARGQGTSVRHSTTLGTELVYAAVAVEGPDGATWIVRTAVPLTRIDDALARLSRWLAASAGAIAVLAIGLAGLFSWRMSRQLEDMRRAAESFARGRFDHELPRAEWEELRSLGAALEDMSRQLDERLRTITRQRNEQQAVLSSMTEGVIAVDRGSRVLSLNGAAAALLGVDAERAVGRPLQELMRDAELGAIVERVLQSGRPQEGEAVRREGGERVLQVRASMLEEEAGTSGAVLVLNDVTRLRRLEDVRREFVANVSHELKTPVTSIKGFVETLRDGALADETRARRFLDIIQRQADRLGAIIEDLLTLSRLEQEGEGPRAPLRPARVRPVLEGALQSCEHQARERGLALSLDCDPDLRAQLSADLLEQAVVNLISNALKYSGEGGSVKVGARPEGRGVAISVEDDGRGISPEHLPRLFERFYRVEKARSRQEGGTGLGLAIVKHVAQVHGGRVSVESELGRGSTFTLHLRGVGAPG